MKVDESADCAGRRGRLPTGLCFSFFFILSGREGFSFSFGRHTRGPCTQQRRVETWKQRWWRARR